MLFFVALLVVFIVGLTTSSVAAVGFSFLILAIGLIYCKKTKTGNPKDASNVFLVTFIIFSILALVRIADINIPDYNFDTLFKSGGDEDDFYEMSQIAAKQRSFYAAVPNITNTLLSSFTGDPISIMMAVGYHMYIGLIGFIASHFFDGNTIIVQLLGSCLFGCLLSVVIYKLLTLYLPSEKSMKYALLGVLCTAFSYYSVCLLRDIHVTFLFALTFYIILRPYNVKNVVKLIIIILLTASFRVWSAIFLSFFALFYFYRRFKDNKVVVTFLVFLTLVIVAVTAISLIDSALERLLVASRNIESRTVEESGYLQLLYRLPIPIRQIAIIASSYMTPFTAWNELRDTNNIYHTIFKFTIVIHEFVLFLVVWLSSKWCIFNKGLKQLPDILFWLLMIVLGYLFVSASSDFTVRRTMCMYPLIYLAFVYLKENVVSKKRLKKDLFLPLSFYILGFVLFVVMNNVN